MTDLTNRQRRRLEQLLRALLPSGAWVEYQLLVGGLFGDGLDDVVNFALISFLHDRIEKLQRLGNPDVGARLRAAEVLEDVQ